MLSTRSSPTLRLWKAATRCFWLHRVTMKHHGLIARRWLNGSILTSLPSATGTARPCGRCGPAPCTASPTTSLCW